MVALPVRPGVSLREVSALTKLASRATDVEMPLLMSLIVATGFLSLDEPLLLQAAMVLASPTAVMATSAFLIPRIVDPPGSGSVIREFAARTRNGSVPARKFEMWSTPPGSEVGHT